MSQKYWQIKKFLERSQWWDQDKINDWQLQRLQQMLKYSYKNVPGYYFFQKESGVKPEEIQRLEDLKYLPFVTKELIRDNLTDFTSRILPEHKRIYTTTSGSTGIPGHTGPQGAPRP
jgi:phenylacetate-CoA ligase